MAVAVAAATQERSMLHQNNTAPRSSDAVIGGAKKNNNGFLSTLASYLTSNAKSDPKPVVQKKPLMTSWDDVDFVKLNKLVCNVLYEHSTYEPLISEIERVVGRRREHCFYGVCGVVLALVLLHDAVGALTAFMTLILPTILTLTTISSTSSYENPTILKNHQDFFVRYWTVYAVFVAGESFLASLIQWDLRLFRLVFMSMCLSSRIPVLAATYAKIVAVVSTVRDMIEANNFEPPIAPTNTQKSTAGVKSKTN